MSGTQAVGHTDNGKTQGARTRGRPAARMAGATRKRTRRTKAQIAAAAQPAALPDTGPVVRVAADKAIAAMQQIDGIIAKLSEPQQLAVDAWYRAKRLAA
jgi:hypothetical protein